MSSLSPPSLCRSEDLDEAASRGSQQQQQQPAQEVEEVQQVKEKASLSPVERQEEAPPGDTDLQGNASAPQREAVSGPAPVCVRVRCQIG